MGGTYSLLECLGTTMLAGILTVASQPTIVAYLEYMGWEVHSPADQREREDLQLVASVLIGLLAILGLLHYTQRLQEDAYDRGMNAERVRNNRDRDSSSNSTSSSESG